MVREDDLGNLEALLMCFYLPSEYQPEHSHPHKVIWKSKMEQCLFGKWQYLAICCPP